MRHAYWRRPDSNIHRPNDDKHAPTALLAEIGNAATLEDGGIRWAGSPLKDFECAAVSSLIVLESADQELNETDSARLIHKSLHEVIRKSGGNTPVKAKELLDTLNRNARTFFRQQTQKRRLIVSLSVKWNDELCVNVFGSTVRTVHRRDFPFPEKLSLDASFVKPHVTSTKYATVAVDTEKISVNQAFDRGTTVINCLRGVWNMIATFRGSETSFSTVPKRKWIGKIHLGPIYMMYDSNNSQAHDIYWFEPDYVEDAKLFKPTKGWTKLEETRSFIFGQIEKSPFRSELIRLFARYATALDQSNLDVTFLMLWSLLERITDTVGASYDETIKRVIWPFEDRAVSKQLLEQMRIRRNRFVHSANSSAEADKLCYITKSFVDEHLRILIQNPYGISSLKEHGEFLALPHSSDRLQKMVDWYQLALSLKTDAFQANDGDCSDW